VAKHFAQFGLCVQQGSDHPLVSETATRIFKFAPQQRMLGARKAIYDCFHGDQLPILG
jgi:hypothetical protein